MENTFFEGRKVQIFVDENKNLAIFSFVLNPDYVFDPNPKWSTDPIEWPPKVLPIFYSKTAIELKYPYSVEELSEGIKAGISAWNKLEPHTSQRVSIEEYYYKIKGFKKATIGKKTIAAGWDSFGKKEVSIFLPVKVGKYYLGIETVSLPDNADWKDFANAVISLVEMDITQAGAYKTYKRKLNV